MPPEQRKEARRRWGALVLEVPAAVAGDVLGLLAPQTSGAESVPGTAGRSRVTVFFRDLAGARGARQAAERVLRASGLVPEACGLHVEPLDDGHWVERYQATLRPFPIGSRFCVHPQSADTPAAGPGGRVPLRLVPGQAFGTGEHPTTQLCTEQLERLVRPGSRWLDLGCGTAILALVALHCGAVEVLALDHDPEAARVAREVVARNARQGRIEVREGCLADGGRDWSGIVANIEGPYFSASAAALAGALAPGGVLIASGFLETDRMTVVEGLAAAGLRFESVVARMEWASAVLRRPEL